MNRRDAVAEALLALAPHLPDYDLAEITDHALASPGLKKAAPDKAAWLSLVSHLRHLYTDYDALLAEGYEPAAARHFCRDAINVVLAEWGCRRRVSGDEDNAS